MAGTHWSPGNPFPSNAVHGGSDIDGTANYVGRSFHNGDLIPTKVIPAKDRKHWSPRNPFPSNAKDWERKLRFPLNPFPSKAVHGGSDIDGITNYVGRSSHNGDLILPEVCEPRMQCIPALENVVIPSYNRDLMLPEVCEPRMQCIPALGNEVPVRNMADRDPLFLSFALFPSCANQIVTFMPKGK